MKLTKGQNIAISIGFVIAIIVSTVSIILYGKNIKESYALSLGINSVSITNNKDMVAIRAYTVSYPIAGYYVGTTSNIQDATYYEAKSNLSFNVSLANGTYYIWVKDTAGNTAKYDKAIKITNSCASDYLSNVKGDGTIRHCYYSDGTYLEETKSEQLITCADGYTRDETKTRIVENTCSLLTAESLRLMGLTKKVCTKVWTYACVSTASSDTGNGGNDTGNNGAGSNKNNNLKVLSATTSSEWTNGNKQINVTSQKGNSNISGYYISTNSKKPTVNSNWVASSSTSWTTSQGAGTYYIWVKDTSGNISTNYKSVTVSKIETNAPTIDSVIPSSINKNLTIFASDAGESGIAGYYVSSENVAPTLQNDWNSTTNTKFVIEKEPGTYYIWVKDAAGNISKGKTAKIFAASNTDNNTLSSLSIKNTDLSPEFSSEILEYTAIAKVSQITVDATLEDSNASFVENYGPRKVRLKNGQNTISIKVKSALGNEKEYKIVVTYNGRTSTSKVTARLKDLKLNSGNLTFDPDITEYRMYVPSTLEKLDITATAEDAAADVKIENPEKLEIGDNKVVITVTATDGTSKVYTLNIIKKEIGEVSSNNYLKSLTISGYEIDFNRYVQEYSISLGKKTYLNINAVAEDSNAEVTTDSTKYLTSNSVINIMVRAEDGSARIYKITLNKSNNSVAKVILIVFGVIVGLLLLAYIILKLMGYSIYINFGAIKERILGLFGKK